MTAHSALGYGFPLFRPIVRPVPCFGWRSLPHCWMDAQLSHPATPHQVWRVRQAPNMAMASDRNVEVNCHHAS